MFDVPPVVRNKARVAGAEWWLDGLPELIASLEVDWGMRVGAPYADATEAFVAPADLADGTRAVCKVIVPRAGDAAANEVMALRLGGGDGMARLIRSDLDRGALLVERLGRPMVELGIPTDRRHELLCDAARRVWRRAADSGLPTGAEKGCWLIEHITATWERLGRPCRERVIEDAIACAERRIAAHDDKRACLVHGDVHQWNALEYGDGFKLIDPDGLLAEPEYDLGIIMREDPVELMAEADPMDRARRLAARCGLDPVAVWEWGVVERVSTGLLLVEVGLQPVANQMLAAAETALDDHPHGSPEEAQPAVTQPSRQGATPMASRHGPRRRQGAVAHRPHHDDVGATRLSRQERLIDDAVARAEPTGPPPQHLDLDLGVRPWKRHRHTPGAARDDRAPGDSESCFREQDSASTRDHRNGETHLGARSVSAKFA